MDRKGIIAVVLSIAVMVWWSMKTQKEIQLQQARQAAAAAAMSPSATPSPEGAGASPTPAASPGEGALAGGTGAVPATPAVPEKRETLKAGAVEYTFTNQGGGIAKVVLLEHEGREASERIALNTLAKHPIGAILQSDDPVNEPYEMTVSGDKVVFERMNASGLQVTKTFTLPSEASGAEAFKVNLEVIFTNRGAGLLEKVDYLVFAGSAEPLRKKDLAYYTGLDWYRDGKATFIDANWFEAKKIPLVGIERAPQRAIYRETPGDVVWAGVKNQYYTSLISTAEGARALGVWGDRLSLTLDETQVYGAEAALVMPGFKLKTGESLNRQFVIYAGPKEYSNLKQLGQGEEAMMNFGMFKLISITLLGAMKWIQGYVGSYALAILILTFIVRGALWPIQGKANKSMKRMQALQPHMTEMREKYKDDPPRMNQEMMKLYKEYGVNPLAGCLPMLIQIPIFFGFYSMLGSAVELRNSGFLWVSDLSRPDTVAYLAGFPINILPILMAATMIWQMQLTPKSGDAMQQKMFMFMPLIFVVFTYNFASALALYYTMQNLLSIVQLYVTRNEPIPTLSSLKKPAPKKRR